MGTGTSGDSSALTFSFPFKVLLFLPPSYQTVDTWNSSTYYKWGTTPILTSYFTTSYSGYTLHLYGGSNSQQQMVRISEDGKIIYLYASSSGNQFNLQNVTYYFAGIGGFDMGGQTEWTLTTSQMWIVPKTGKYQLELYGGRGGANMYSNSSDGSCTGGSSCQTYDSIQLTMNQQINVVIGEAGKSYSSQASTSGGATSFGTYTVSGGTRSFYGLNRQQYYYSLGSGARNKGTSGESGWELGKINPSTGTYRSVYRYGGYSYNSGNNIRYVNGGPRAVYLKYLGT